MSTLNVAEIDMAVWYGLANIEEMLLKFLKNLDNYGFS